jgi:hypothetical protein
LSLLNFSAYKKKNGDKKISFLTFKASLLAPIFSCLIAPLWKKKQNFLLRNLCKNESGLFFCLNFIVITIKNIYLILKICLNH